MGSGSAGDISVLVPLYNHERYVADALHSVLRQTAPPKEIICIDDGSKDRSAAVVSRIAGQSDRVRFWSRPNRGAAATLNEAAGAAKGSILAVLNSDDLYLPRRLARAAAVLEADDRIAAVATDLICIDAEGNEIHDRWQVEATDFFRKTGELGLSLVNGNFLRTTSNLVVRRTVFEEIGGFDDLRYAHDLHFFLRLVGAGKRMAILKEKLLGYRLHGANTIAEAHTGVRAEWAAVSAFYARDLLLSSRKGSRDELDVLFGVLHRHGLDHVVEGLLAAIQLANGTAASPSALLHDHVFRKRLTTEVEVRV